MYKIKITILKRHIHNDLIEKYENESSCEIRLNDVFYSIDDKNPDDFCNNAWKPVGPYVERLAKDEDNFFNGWMKNKKSANVSCDDGFRPVSFYVEVVE